MKGFCNFADERSATLFSVKDIIEINGVDPQLEGKPVEGKSSFSTSLLYNISYGLVNTHRKYYIPSGIFVKRKMASIIPNGISEGMDKKAVGERIRLIRKTLGLTQAEMGEKIGRSWKTINRWEAGERDIPDTALKLISQVFGVSYEWLKTGQGEMWEKREKFPMSVGERIKQLREFLGLTQTEFASRIGLTYKMLGLYERGKYEPPEKVLKLISSTFGVSYEWLKEGKGEMWGRKDKAILEGAVARLREFAERLVRIPIVGDAGAGFPKSPADIEVVGYILVSKETLQKGGRFAVQVRGDSMEPTLQDGDFVVFKPYVGDGADIPNGKVVVVRNIGGELVVKRLVRIDSVMMLVPDNPKYPPMQPSADLQIVGVAVEAIKRIEL